MSQTPSLLQTEVSNNFTTSLLGAEGERLAKVFLEKQAFRIVLANFKTPVGRNRKDAIINGEIDLIAYEHDILCFIEVKTRSSDEFSSPLSAVDLRKQRQIIRTARIYRKIFHLEKSKFRYDAIGIILNEKKPPKIELFRNFFDENKFRKNTWFEK